MYVQYWGKKERWKGFDLLPSCLCHPTGFLSSIALVARSYDNQEEGWDGVSSSLLHQTAVLSLDIR